MKHNDYLFSTGGSGFKFLRRFDDMYKNCVDPHGQSTELDRIDYQIVSAVLDRVVRDRGGEPRILDVGCGLGYYTSHLRQQFPDADVAGCDISETALQKAEVNAPGCRFFPLDLKERLSVPGGSFDIIVALHVICYFTEEEISDVVGNLRELLDRGGYLMIGHHLPEKMSFARYMQSLDDARSLFEPSGFEFRLELDLTNEFDMTYSGDPVGRNIFFLAQRD